MSLEIRIIGQPDEVAEAEVVLRDRFVIHSMRHYASKYSETDRRSYIRASLKAESGVTAPLEVPQDIANLRIKLRDLGDRNNVFLCYRFETDRYLDFATATLINHAVQDDLRTYVGRGIHADGRLDQTYKNAYDVAVYRSPNIGWLTVPFKGDSA